MGRNNIVISLVFTHMKPGDLLGISLSKIQ